MENLFPLSKKFDKTYEFSNGTTLSNFEIEKSV
jgi:hypothetical protein